MNFSLIKTAWAQNAVNVDVMEDPLGNRFGSLANIFGWIMNLVFWVGIALTVIFLIVGGIRYITSGGSKEGTEAARNMITNAVIGFIVVIGAFAIRVIMGRLLGPNVPTNVVPPF